MGTRNTAFEWSTGNLENLKNVKCRICDQNGTQQICDSKNVESRICEKKKEHNQSVNKKRTQSICDSKNVKCRICEKKRDTL